MLEHSNSSLRGITLHLLLSLLGLAHGDLWVLEDDIAQKEDGDEDAVVLQPAEHRESEARTTSDEMYRVWNHAQASLPAEKAGREGQGAVPREGKVDGHKRDCLLGRQPGWGSRQRRWWW